MNQRNLTLLLAFVAMAALTAGAQPHEGPPAEGRLFVVLERSPLFTALDFDDDGVISAGEILWAPESLAELDRNDDGRITPDEIFRLRLREGEREGGERRVIRLRDGGEEGSKQLKIVSPIFNTLDIDGDGTLSAAEVADSWITLLDLDADGDGVLTLDEVRPSGREFE